AAAIVRLAVPQDRESLALQCHAVVARDLGQRWALGQVVGDPGRHALDRLRRGRGLFGEEPVAVEIAVIVLGDDRAVEPTDQRVVGAAADILGEGGEGKEGKQVGKLSYHRGSLLWPPGASLA